MICHLDIIFLGFRWVLDVLKAKLIFETSVLGKKCLGESDRHFGARFKTFGKLDWQLKVDVAGPLDLSKL